MGISPYIATLREKVGNDLLLLPSVGAVIFDDQRRVLLQRARDDGKWYVPGGAMEPGEEPADAVVREMLEETGLIVEPRRIIGVYGSPLITYPNGHRVQYVGAVFLCSVVGGELKVSDDESLELRYFDPSQLPELRADHRERIMHALAERPEAYFAPTNGFSRPASGAAK
jgi:8-oxo-dGTP pyrophosphatase MutT (NUDIX family)